MRQFLDGWWEFQPATEAAGDAPPPSNGFEEARIRVPGYWNSLPPEIGGDWGAYDHYRYPPHWSEAQAAWYRRRFTPDAALLKGAARVRLRFDAVAGKSTVWLNGVRLGENVDRFLPFELDISDHLRASENELVLLVQPPPQKGGLWLQPCGSWVGWFLRGIWQSVCVEATPAIAVSDVFVQPSVRDSRLDVDVRLAAKDAPSGAAVRVTLFDGSRKLADLGVRTIDGQSAPEDTIRFSLDNPGLEYWTPESPKLYDARAELRIDGRVVHEHTVRFGFREFWIEGDRFVLNGKPIRLFGDSWHYMGPAQQNPAYARTWFDFARRTGVNVIRTHAMPYPPLYFEIADEVGMLIIDETAVYGSAGTLAFEEPAFWDAARDHVRRLVLRDRNHPSIILWSACNETVWKAGERIYPALLSLGEAAHALDPTRRVSYDENDCDLGGGSPVHAGHYGTPEHWRRAWKRDKPLTVHEFSSLYHGGPESVSHIGGDEVYADFRTRLRAAGEDAAGMFMQLRRLGAASITPWNLTWYCLEPAPAHDVENIPDEATAGGAAIDRIGARALTLNFGFAPDAPALVENPAFAPLAACYRRQRFHIARRPRQGHCGQVISFEVCVFNDEQVDADLRVSAGVGGGAETIDRNLHLGACESTTISFELRLPVQSTNGLCSCAVALAEAPGAELYREEWGIHVDPRRELETAGKRQTWIASADEPVPGSMPTELATLVLNHPLGEPFQEWLARSEVAHWVWRGGRVMVLPGALDFDDTSELAPMRRRSDHAYIRDAGPLLQGLTDAHFRDWPPDGVVAEALFQRPETGPACIPLDCGDSSEGLARTPLVILPRGDGDLVLCGMPLIERATDTPAAAILLERLVCGDLPAAPSRSASICAGRDTVVDFHQRVGLEHAADGAVVICDGSDPRTLIEPSCSAERIENTLSWGGDIVLIGVTPETIKPWNARLGLDLELREDECFNVVRARPSTLLNGVNNFDLCWVHRDEKQPIVRHTLALRGDAESLVVTTATRWEDYQLAAEQHKIAMMHRRMDAFDGPRAAVLEVPHGGGRILVIQLLLAEARGSFRPRALRILSRMLDALGVARDGRADPLTPRGRTVVDANGYLRQWLVLGPFPSGTDHALDHAFVDEPKLAPRGGAGAGGCCWQQVDSRYPQVDLSEHFGSAERPRIAYAATYVYSPGDRSVLLGAPDMIGLLAGADGGIKVLLNGRSVGRFDFVREFVADSDRVDSLPLGKGWNTLVLKLHNPGGAWRFAARLRDASGRPAGDLRFALAPLGTDGDSTSEIP